MRSAPITYDLIEDTIPPPLRLDGKPEQEVAIYAWADPQGGRHLLHLVVISRRGAAHTVNLWLSDLERIVQYCAKDPHPLVFRLTPNVRALEVLGEAGIQAGHLPKSWRKVLRRGHADPKQDFAKSRAM